MVEGEVVAKYCGGKGKTKPLFVRWERRSLNEPEWLELFLALSDGHSTQRL